MSHQANKTADDVYNKIKSAIFDFRLLPGEHFTENQLAELYGVSRTPVRGALYRLRQEGYLDVQFRSGWSVRAFDFVRFDELYDLRIVIECAAIERLCASPEPPEFPDLRSIWLVASTGRKTDPRTVAALDEEFHARLVSAAGNNEMAKVHADLTEQIRIVRRLDFLKERRIVSTYSEHGKILRLIQQRDTPKATAALRAHVSQSKLEVREITIHMMQEARRANENAKPAAAEPRKPAQTAARAKK